MAHKIVTTFNSSAPHSASSHYLLHIFPSVHYSHFIRIIRLWNMLLFINLNMISPDINKEKLLDYTNLDTIRIKLWRSQQSHSSHMYSVLAIYALPAHTSYHLTILITVISYFVRFPADFVRSPADFVAWWPLLPL